MISNYAYSDPEWDNVLKENAALKDALEQQIYHFEAVMNNENCGEWYDDIQHAKKLIEKGKPK